MKIGFTKLNTLRQLLGYFSIDLYRPHQVNLGPQIGETKYCGFKNIQKSNNGHDNGQFR